VVVAGLLEILGWGARLWSSKSPFLLRPYEMQYVLSIFLIGYAILNVHVQVGHNDSCAYVLCRRQLYHLEANHHCSRDIIQQVTAKHVYGRFLLLVGRLG
jgi:hypothetical protein